MDAQLYAEAAKQCPELMEAIFFRDVGPEAACRHGDLVRESVAETQQHRVPLHLIANSHTVAKTAC
ncbi:hypothetical protein [Aureliella helgolandensis]|uniref:hypothetical protein n=1 Tax=Aureliella helgolandensis TaxID=2527968 RepID=UPI0011A7D640|nr:hypothetical protein [Aureliella helgolandensis]